MSSCESRTEDSYHRGSIGSLSNVSTPRTRSCVLRKQLFCGRSVPCFDAKRKLAGWQNNVWLSLPSISDVQDSRAKVFRPVVDPEAFRSVTLSVGAGELRFLPHPA